MIMKRLLEILFLAAAATGLAFGQAPASVAGYTLRIVGRTDVHILPSFQYQAIDLLGNGTFVARVNATIDLIASDFSYATPLNGTYNETHVDDHRRHRRSR